MQPPLTRFQGIDLTHYLIGKNNVFASHRREVCFRVITINQECRAVIREGCFPLGGKMSKDKAVRLSPAMKSWATCRLNSMLWERCLAMASILGSPVAPVNSKPAICPPPGAHSI